VFAPSCICLLKPKTILPFETTDLESRNLDLIIYYRVPNVHIEADENTASTLFPISDIFQYDCINFVTVSYRSFLNKAQNQDAGKIEAVLFLRMFCDEN